ncbi:CMRF35-like molecule 1 [Silurus meridionalis]|uniref:CMRF35-like molecule 1 n=1 Tax=Silurus meridionalis TaxID=175797 RepID=UPI001EEA6ACB|nr:CMRF35-like molecule 1 [Silurus meridionalis]
MNCFFIFILFISNVVISQSAYRQLSLQTGASVTIPCLYDRKYIHHKKYWCYNYYSLYTSCTIQAYANDTQGKVTVTDNPVESLFTVTMKDLQTGNTGSYWCAVEIEGITYDVTEYLYITVKADPDLSVRESSVSGDEGGSVTVQCLYSAAYQTTEKQWCKFRDRRCNSVTRTDTSQKSAVHISDDGKSSLIVQMSGLKKSDGGWYWCSAGDLEVPVHISVRDPPPVVTTAVTTTTNDVTTYTSVSNHNSAASETTVVSSDETIEKVHWYLIAFLVLLVMLVIIVIIIIGGLLKKNRQAENQIRTRGESSNPTVPTPTFRAEDTIIYSTVTNQKSSALKDNDDVTYSSVKIASKNKTVSPNVVEGETIYSSIVFQ